MVLPVTTFLEKEDIVLSDGGNYLLFSNRAVEPLAGAMDDYDIFSELAGRLGFCKEFAEGRSKEDWLKFMISGSEVPDYEEFRHNGIYWGRDQMRVGFSDFVADPNGHPLNTPSGLVEISSKAYAKTGFSEVPECRVLPVDADYPLRLVTPKSRNRIHSQNYNIPWFRDREEQTLWINPADADPRGIKNRCEVLIESPEGRVRIKARVTEEIMQGVTCLMEGAWPSFDPDGIEVAGSPNVLTSTTPTTPSQGSRTHSVLVRVRPARAFQETLE
jgi:anaerobic dimethyl sulfoxide reductase subunit A